MGSMTPLEEIRHSCAHVMATAVLRLFPEAKLDIGPPTETGFYYDLDLDRQITGEDLEQIEEEMSKVVKENQPFERFETNREEAEKLIREMGQERYKLGRLADIPEGEPISFYRNGEFVDLCAGTHVNYTKKLKAFKLLSVAGAYHRGDAANKQLQRIYGTAFPNKTELAEYLEKLEEAKSATTANSAASLTFSRSMSRSAPDLFSGPPGARLSARSCRNSSPRNCVGRATPRYSLLISANLACTGPAGTFPTTGIRSSFPSSRDKPSTSSPGRVVPALNSATDSMKARSTASSSSR